MARTLHFQANFCWCYISGGNWEQQSGTCRKSCQLAAISHIPLLWILTTLWPPEPGLWGRRSRSTRNYGGLALPGLPGISQTNIHFGLSPVQKQNALRRKCISGLFCISQRHARIHIYLNNYSEWRERGKWFSFSLLLSFLWWAYKCWAKGILLTNERAEEKVQKNRIVPLPGSGEDEGRRRMRGHKPGHRQAHKDM